MSDPLSSPEFLRDPYPFYDELRAASPVRRTATGPGGGPGYLVTGYAEAKAAFTEPGLSKDTARFFAGRPSGRDLHPAVARTMLATDPPEHTRLRRLVTEAFTAGAVDRLRPYLRDTVDRLLDALPDGGEADLVAGLAVPLPVAVICRLLGVPEADRARVRAWSDDLFAAGRPERIDAASHAVAGYLAGLVEAKRRAPDDSLLSGLVAVRDTDGDRLGEEELVSLAVLLLIAGHETTTNFIGNAVLALLRHPELVDRVRAEPDRTGEVLEELLRYDSPVGIATFRYTTRPVTLGGTEIPAGVPVLISPGAANRDPARYPRPDRPDPDRGARGHLAFGHGVHRCPGASLALAEAETAVRALLARFPGLRLAVGADELRWRRTRLMRGLEALPVFTR
ncbi:MULTISPECIES: cytochrome P450 family protein [Streptomyces]|uniref:cytochrome P450 family protein n=1 Tax=Streptomyces TaxID=1883 RepID=UPI00163BC20A|nr:MULTISPECIES: cytochrome P450 [Streptomyces]MBC2874274.1 cytochrome P450 [Streptomyces sp. TYQ1024]UBI40310.1 cytochrome P450 [Streptomyces mobaraensis]UKW32890.1 cytochrome P450 [Streptomyces sp. TYQ1024]